MKAVAAALLGLALSAWVTACQPQAPRVGAVPPEATGLERVLILPFKDLYAVFGKEGSYRCLLSSQIHFVEPSSAGADRELTAQLADLVNNSTDYRATVADRPADLLAAQALGASPHLNELQLLIAVGRGYAVDAVLAGYLYRFVDRAGGRYAAESPASVAFGLFLVDVARQRVVWSRHFDETQRALTENLFDLRAFIRRRGRWVSAREMAFSGLEDMIRELPPP